MSSSGYSASERRRIEAVRDELAGRFPQQAALVAEAVELAAHHHGGQRRKSGEPFVMHPLEVARILAQDGLGHETVIAGICHDLLEDTDCARGELVERFGEAVAAIVDGVTKVSRSAAKLSPSARKAGTYQKLILAAADDARVLPVKLADRLHNLRTIQALSRDRQEAIARETLLVYAPLAHRLGMSRIKTELEDRSLAIVDPAAYAEATAIQAEHKSRAERELGALRGELAQALSEAGLEAELTARIKSRYSIAEKLGRAEAREIADVLGLRVITESVEQCYLALGVIHRLWPPKPGTFDDYIATPRSNLYQSLHTTVIAHGATVEVQIRTREMHDVAEHGIAAHWAYKETLRAGGPPPTRRFLDRAAEGQRGEGEEALTRAYEDLRRELFAEDLLVFTPKGDPRLLPEGACAIDMAYTVHTELGDRITGARVDGRLYPITRPLPQGAVVEIIASEEGQPSLDWLEAVKTNRARSRIRAHHQADLDRELAERGRELLVRELRKAGMAPLARAESLEEALGRIGYDDPTDAMRAAASERSRLRYLVRRLIREVAPRPQAAVPEAPAPPRKSRRQAPEGSVLVEGMAGIATRLAGCCHPEPGDEIVGFISLGRGVSVHRRGCRNVAQLHEAQRERLVDVRWAKEGRAFTLSLDVSFLDRPNLLHRIGEAIYGSGAEFVGIDLHLRSGGVVRGILRVRATSTRQANKVRERLAAIEGSLSIERAGALRRAA